MTTTPTPASQPSPAAHLADKNNGADCVALGTAHPPSLDNETGRRVFDDPHGRVAARYSVQASPAYFVGTLDVQPVEVIMHDLRITANGITYRGETVEDAGAVHRALLEVMNGQRQLPSPARSDTTTERVAYVADVASRENPKLDALKAKYPARSDKDAERTMPDRMTERKTAEVTRTHGYQIVGYVMQKPGGDYCLSSQSAVRWLDQRQYWRLMHEQDGSLFAPKAQESAPSSDSIGDDNGFCDLITELDAAHEQVGGDASKKAWAALVRYIHDWFARHALAAKAQESACQWPTCQPESVQQEVTAPTELATKVRELAEKWNKDAIDTGFAMSEPACEVFDLLDHLASNAATAETAEIGCKRMESGAATAAPGDLTARFLALSAEYEAKRLAADNPNIERIYLGAREAYSDAALIASNAGAAPGIPESQPIPEPSPLYFKALDMVNEAGFASVSMVQRRLRIGWNAARDLILLMADRSEIPEAWLPPAALIGRAAPSSPVGAKEKDK